MSRQAGTAVPQQARAPDLRPNGPTIIANLATTTGGQKVNPTALREAREEKRAETTERHGKTRGTAKAIAAVRPAERPGV